MTRIKFLIFGLVAVGAVAAHLLMASGAVVSKIADQGATATLGAASAVQVRLEAIRSELQAAALKVASHSSLWGRSGAPSAERVNQFRAAALEALPESLKAGAIVGLITEAGSMISKGEAPEAMPEGVDAKALAQPSSTVEVFGAIHHVVALPLHALDKADAKVVGSAFIAVPATLSADALAAVVKDHQLTGVGLAVGGTVVVSGGDKMLVDKAAKSGKANSTAAVESGEVVAMGPLKFPLGGAATLAVGAQREVGPWNVIAVQSVRAALEPVANDQKASFFVLVGLLLATVAFVALGGGEAPRPAMSIGSMPSVAPQLGMQRKVDTAPAPVPAGTHAPPKETTADDFNFDSKPTGQVPPPPPPPAAPPPPPEGFEDGEQRTTAYPAHMAAAMVAQDPMSLIGGGGAQEEFSQDSTRVAAVPQDLLRAAARSGADEASASKTSPGALPKMASVAPMAQDPDEAHFQEVFKEFVSVREKCNEPADGLTYDRFLVKLKKNREQLVQKYNCKTVRFQVYVKDGKAALKASPVKE